MSFPGLGLSFGVGCISRADCLTSSAAYQGTRQDFSWGWKLGEAAETVRGGSLGGSAGPQGSLGIPRKPYIYLFLKIVFIIFWIFDQILKFLAKIVWFLSFSSKNDAESSRNSIKN